MSSSKPTCTLDAEERERKGELDKELEVDERMNELVIKEIVQSEDEPSSPRKVPERAITEKDYEMVEKQQTVNERAQVDNLGDEERERKEELEEEKRKKNSDEMSNENEEWKRRKMEEKLKMESEW